MWIIGFTPSQPTYLAVHRKKDSIHADAGYDFAVPEDREVVLKGFLAYVYHVASKSKN